MEFEDWIVVYKLENLLRPDGESHNDFPRLEILARTGNYAGFDQRNNGVGDELALNAKVLAIGKEGQHRIRQTADSSLQHCPILDKAGYVARHCNMHVGDNWLLEFA